jgi:hypothetical protein
MAPSVDRAAAEAAPPAMNLRLSMRPPLGF